MALITRVARLFRADLHAVLDRIEEPDILLRQAVRDMEEQLAGDQQRLRLLNHEQEQIESRARELDPTLHDIEEQLQVCFDAGKDDLARALIRRRLETQRYSKHLQRRHAVLQDTRTALTARVNEQHAQLEAMRQKAELLTEDAASERPGDICDSREFGVRDEDVEVAFVQEKQRRSRS
jgi:phage shock protein A